MSTGAVIVMLIGMLILWGGLATSIVVAVRRGRSDAEGRSAPPSS